VRGYYYGCGSSDGQQCGRDCRLLERSLRVERLQTNDRLKRAQVHPAAGRCFCCIHRQMCGKIKCVENLTYVNNYLVTVGSDITCGKTLHQPFSISYFVLKCSAQLFCNYFSCSTINSHSEPNLLTLNRKKKVFTAKLIWFSGRNHR